MRPLRASASCGGGSGASCALLAEKGSACLCCFEASLVCIHEALALCRITGVEPLRTCGCCAEGCRVPEAHRAEGRAPAERRPRGVLALRGLQATATGCDLSPRGVLGLEAGGLWVVEPGGWDCQAAYM
mmetsp:Transcript_3348/g.10231  ORF Transcript_3348/g.10231 Transcript_3348/m.10231 type:complete len:129 (+) Transcript_3348:365-751(+)